MASATRVIQKLRNWASGVRAAGRKGRAGMGVGGCELRRPGPAPSLCPVPWSERLGARSPRPGPPLSPGPQLWRPSARDTPTSTPTLCQGHTHLRSHPLPGTHPPPLPPVGRRPGISPVPDRISLGPGGPGPDLSFSQGPILSPHAHLSPSLHLSIPGLSLSLLGCPAG